MVGLKQGHDCQRKFSKKFYSNELVYNTRRLGIQHKHFERVNADAAEKRVQSISSHSENPGES